MDSWEFDGYYAIVDKDKMLHIYKGNYKDNNERDKDEIFSLDLLKIAREFAYKNEQGLAQDDNVVVQNGVLVIFERVEVDYFMTTTSKS